MRSSNNNNNNKGKVSCLILKLHKRFISFNGVRVREDVRNEERKS